MLTYFYIEHWTFFSFISQFWLTYIYLITFFYCKIHWYDRNLSHNTVFNGPPRIGVCDEPCVNAGMLKRYVETEIHWAHQNAKCKNETFQMLTIAGNIERAFRSTSVGIITLMYLFISNYMGQKVTDMSSNICEKVWVIYFLF